MKRELLAIILVLVVFLLTILKMGQVPEAYTQVSGTTYFWAETLHVTTSLADTVFPVRWEDVTIIGSADVSLVVGASDTASWSSRIQFPLDTYNAVRLGPGSKLIRLGYKTATGTATLYLTGIKRSAQF